MIISYIYIKKPPPCGFFIHLKYCRLNNFISLCSFTVLVIEINWGMSGPAKIKCTILGRKILGIPSASGVSVIGSSIYVIGDNSPWLYKLSSDYTITDKIQLNPETDLPNGVYAKKDKPDFEALATVKTEGTWKLLAFGSGSKSPQRDVLVVVDPEDLSKLKSYSMIGFYNQLRFCEAFRCRIEY